MRSDVLDGRRNDQMLRFFRKIRIVMEIPDIQGVAESRQKQVFLRIRLKIRKLLRVLDTPHEDRKSTRLNSSHVAISYAVFCLKKKKKTGTLAVYRYIARSKL